MQMRALEEELGGDLFERRGRRLILTALGNEIAWYAEEVTRLARDASEVARGHERPRRTPLRVGVVGSIPKALAFRLLEPALTVEGYGPIAARQDTQERLLEELAVGRLHLVLADTAPPQGGALRLFDHALGSSELSLYGTPDLAEKYRGDLPRALSGAPMLLPMRGTALRRSIERWLGEHGVRVRVEGEFDDVGLMRVFGLRGRGVFPVRAAMAAEIEDIGGVVCLGPIPGALERYFAISVERRVRHPAVNALIESARGKLGTEGQSNAAPVSTRSRHR
jgi:LysR family transcriptional activator of nhaA